MWCCLIAAGGLLAGCAPEVERSEGVRLMLVENTLDAGTTFELRFDEAVVADSEVGRPATNSPLIIQPLLAGQFVWLSPRSGVFTPVEPTKLGAEYRLSLRSGLNDAQGRRLGARLLRKVRAPDFSVIAHGRVNFSPEYVPAEPEVLVQFNAPVDTNVAATFFAFANTNGVLIRASVAPIWETDEASDITSIGGVSNPKIWVEQFQAWQTAKQITNEKAARKRQSDTTTNSILAPIPGRFSVKPEKPLIAGNAWELVIDAGLPSADRAGLRLKKPFVIPIGDVKPFVVTEIECVNRINSGRRLRLQFSKSLSQELTASNLTEWIQITPTVEPAAMRLMGSGIEVDADFDLHKSYRVQVKAGLPAAEPFVLGEAVDQEVVFKPVPPRIFLPSFSAEQLSGGGRRIELLSVNVASLRVRAKWLDQDQLIHALRGYKGYFKERSWDDQTREPYKEVDFNLLAGKTVFRTNLALEASQDQALKTVLSWDSILGGRTHGAVFIMAESSSPADPVDDPGAGGRLSKSPLGSQTLLQLTDLGLYWKTTATRLWVTVFSYASGKPVSGASVRLMDNDGQSVAEQTSDANGVAIFESAPQAAWLLAKCGGDLHATALDAAWENRLPVDYSIPREWNEEHHESRKLMLFTDRSVYRPGETLHLKAILRDFKQDALEVPLSATGKLVCLDARQRTFWVTNVVFSTNGSCATSVVLPTECRGTYRADLAVDTNLVHYQQFEVQDFQPNSFEIMLDAPAAFAASEAVAVPVRAKYLHGRPVAKAKLAWSFDSRDDGFAPEGWEDFRFCNHAEVLPGQGSSSVAMNGETNYTSAPGWALRPEIAINPVVPQPRAVNGLVELTDASQQTLAQATRFIRHSSEFYLGIKSLPSVVASNTPTPVYLVATRTDGTPETNAVKIQLRLRKVDWRSVRMQGAGKTIRYQNEPEFQLINEQEAVACPVVRDGEKWFADTNAAPSAVLTPMIAGMYLLEAIATDSAGRRVVSALNIQVTGDGRLGWNYRNEVQIELVPDRKTYLPGQTASLLVKTPISGMAVVSVERDRILTSYVTNLTGNAPAVQVPIPPAYAPNVVVTVFVVRGASNSPHEFKDPEYRVGYANLTVENPATQLQVEMGADKTDYQPGQRIAVLGTVRDAQGLPAVGAEVVCYAVDEGVLALNDYQTPDPGAYFWSQRPLGVFSHSSLPSLMPEDSGLWQFQNKGYLVGGGGEATASGLRKRFLPCAYWNPSLITDGLGQFTANFVAPDSLTRYRLIAVVLRSGGQFGFQESHFRVNKPLMLDPALPRFAHVGDQLIARAVLHNLTGKTIEAEIGLNLDDKVKGAGPAFNGARATQKITLSPTRETIVEFPVEFTRIGLSRWVWEAKTSASQAGQDRVESTVPVEYATALIHEVYLARVTTTATNLLAKANPQLFESQGTLTVTVANSRMASLGEAVASLLHYPYGCAEQTSSSLLPWIVWRDFMPFFPGVHTNQAEVDLAINKGVARLLSMQTESGGLAYWPGGKKAESWVSAYGGMALALAKKQGRSVPDGEFDTLLKYLSQSLRESPAGWQNEGLSDRCLALYTLALARKSEPGYHEQMFEKRDLLSGESRALLALAILESDGQREMALELLAPKVGPPAQGDLGFGCPERELAVQLLAWLRANSEGARVESLAEELFHSQKLGRWSTTQGNAWGLIALADYVRKIELNHFESSGQLMWQNEKREFKLSAQPAALEMVFPCAAKSASRELNLENPGQHPLFVRVAAEFHPLVQRQPRENRGFGLRREYALVDDEGKVGEYRNARVGDLVLVTLNLESSQMAHYVAIDDALPAILEPVNPRFKSRETRVGNALDNEWEDDFHELRQDRALFFRNYLAPGQYTIRYLARVRAAGTAIAPSAKVEEMYHPERFGLSETQDLQSRALE